MTETFQKTDPKKVSFGLGLGIVFLPLIFSWFTLKNGYSTLARVLAFGWLGLGLLGFALADEKPSQKTAMIETQKTVTPIVENTSQKTEIPKIKKQKFYRMNERIELGGFAYTITNVEATSVIKHFLGKYKAGKNAIFYLVHFDIENLQKKTDVVLVDDFKLLDEKGREFSPSAEASTQLAMTGKQELLLSQLQPGISKSMITAFEVPRDSVSPDPPTLVIPEKGLLSTGKVKVSMPPVELCPKKRGKKSGKKLSSNCS